MVGDAIQQGRGHFGIAKNCHPLGKASALMRIDPPMLNKTDPPTKSPVAEADPTGGCGQSMLDSLW
jgi:hypothetical protein